ncbi:hypothetical protein DL240_03970 [Lujinxingia litoralis]|uniref:Uncharacterized protein n=1 Tax=Lujinxingia litoralis TaxID=2211119 RepID=A0A328CA78_9DELT|nr:hypothetical protein [Lujinxingia litoralis]RAL25375.1 hypothetical protein DL240_03970 [Lujinxingia litoralis]
MTEQKQTQRADAKGQARYSDEQLLDAKCRQGSDRIEGAALPLYAYLSDDPADDPRGPIEQR